MGYDSVLAAHYHTMGLQRHSLFPPPSPNSKYLPSVRPPLSNFGNTSRLPIILTRPALYY